MVDSSQWQIKLERAHRHPAELRQQIDHMKTAGDLAVTTDVLGLERTVRLVIRREPPAELSAIVGDIVHNTRSALDCFALAACVASATRTDETLTENEERST